MPKLTLDLPRRGGAGAKDPDTTLCGQVCPHLHPGGRRQRRTDRCCAAASARTAIPTRDWPGNPEFCNRVEAAKAAGQSVMLVAEDGVVRGYLAVSDPPRSNGRAALAALKQTGTTRTVMLTGDNTTVAGAVGQELDLDDVRSGLLPQDKVTAVQALVAEYGQVAMGGAGTAQALETADVAPMADDLAQLPAAMRIGRRAVSTIRFNIWFALLVKAVFLIAALAGRATMWMAVFADVGASLLVTLNGMRLLLDRPNK